VRPILFFIHYQLVASLMHPHDGAHIAVVAASEFAPSCRDALTSCRVAWLRVTRTPKSTFRRRRSASRLQRRDIRQSLANSKTSTLAAAAAVAYHCSFSCSDCISGISRRSYYRRQSPSLSTSLAIHLHLESREALLYLIVYQNICIFAF